MAAPKTYNELCALLPDAHVERVGEREELVIYTGLTVERDDDGNEHHSQRLVPMGDD